MKLPSSSCLQQKVSWGEQDIVQKMLHTESVATHRLQSYRTVRLEWVRRCPQCCQWRPNPPHPTVPPELIHFIQVIWQELKNCNTNNLKHSFLHSHFRTFTSQWENFLGGTRFPPGHEHYNGRTWSRSTIANMTCATRKEPDGLKSAQNAWRTQLMKLWRIDYMVLESKTLFLSWFISFCNPCWEQSAQNSTLQQAHTSYFRK